MELLVLVLAAFAAAFVAPAIHRRAPGLVSFVLAAVPLAIATRFFAHMGRVSHGGVVTTHVEWLPQLGVNLALRLDGLSLLFGLLITVIGTLVTLYAGSYLHGAKDLGRFYLYLYLFMGAMLGLVLADDLIALFIFWELTSISSFFLIGYHTEQADSRRRALQALFVTGAGGLALLAGLILLSVATGETTLSAVNAAGSIANVPLATPILLLLLLGAFTKSAQFPFHFWLPGAMVAPSPVSAYLHSATMVKAGVYLLARLHPALADLALWTPIVASFGFVTLTVGTVLALRQTDLKLILAYTTVSSLGFMVFLLGLGSKYAATGAIVFLLAHALYKGALFLIAGIVDHGTGTRDIRLLGRLRHAMPVTAIAALIAGLSFAGLPPLFGFLGKEVAFAAIEQAPGGLFLLAATVLLFIGGVLAAGMVAIVPFWRKDAGELPHKPHEGDWAMLLGPVLLGLVTFVAGIGPKLVDERLVSPAVSAVLGKEVHAHLALWHGFNIVLAASIAVLAIGFLLLPRAQAIGRSLNAAFARLDALGPEQGYKGLIKGIDSTATRQANFWQHGILRRYLSVMVGFTVLAAAAAWYLRDGSLGIPGLNVSVTPFGALLVAAMVTSAFAVTRLPSRLAAVAALGVVGYSIALLFLLFGAPDLAMTQFLFETLSVLIFLRVLWGMPKIVARSSTATKMRDAILAGSVGLLMTLLVLVATTNQFADPISAFYRAASYTEAFGRNVVNVILVDFRGIDTMGEITVLAVAAMGVVALLRMRSRGEP
ncbi:MAG: hydrogen gas-evolving membrane-bound hydrogenase subunit E [Thermoplasmatota archaeon]